MKSSTKIDTASIIAASGIEFGTSGARGLVTSFNFEVCAAYVTNFLLKCDIRSTEKTLLLARDNRPSSEQIMGHCASAASNLGYRVEDQGVLPTPALASYAHQRGVPCIVVTGSHIPFDRNGLKFYTATGEISKNDEVVIANSAEFLPPITATATIKSDNASHHYVSRYTRFFGRDFMRGCRVGLYQHSAAGRDLYLRLFEELGATVIPLGRTDSFVPIDTEAVSVDDERIGKLWAEQHNLDCIFSTDGDGDRPLVADEFGVWLKGDHLCMLAAIALNIGAVVMPVSCSTEIERSDQFKVCFRTKIGSPYVIEGMEAVSQDFDGPVAGFEANGGFLLGGDLTSGDGVVLPALKTRDSVLPFLAVWKMARKTMQPISHLLTPGSGRVALSSRLQNIDRDKCEVLIQRLSTDTSSLEAYLAIGRVSATNFLDGVRMQFTNSDIVHYRLSGNAPELRCYVEASSKKEAARILDDALNFASIGL